MTDYFIPLGFILLVIVLGLIGGQGIIPKNKGYRRFGIPILSSLTSLKDGFQKRDLVPLLFIPTLVQGYGESSWLGQLLPSDDWVRFVYSTLLSLPFLFFGLKRFGIAFLAMVFAFQVKHSWVGGGATVFIGSMQILWEDVFRYGILGALTWFIIIRRR